MNLAESWAKYQAVNENRQTEAPLWMQLKAKEKVNRAELRGECTGVRSDVFDQTVGDYETWKDLMASTVVYN